jgi:hypothetical protein
MKHSREVIMRIAAAHQDKRALDILGMEMAYVFHSHIANLVRNINCARNNPTNILRPSKTITPLSLLINPNLP